MLLNSFRGTRQTHCTAKFDELDASKEDCCYSFEHDILDNLFVTYNLHESDLHRSDMMVVPDKISSMIGPEIFHFLEFNLWKRNMGDIYRFLDYSLSNCPRLQSLKITCYFEERVISSLSFRYVGQKVSSDQANRDINFLHVENTTAKCLGLVVAHLHNIETVSLKSQDWSRKYDNQVIDLTGFKKLKHYKYTSTYEFYETENRYVLIKYTDGAERRVYQNGNTKDKNYRCFTLKISISVSLEFNERKQTFEKH